MPYIVGSLSQNSLNMTGGVVQSGVTTTTTTSETAIVSISAPKYQSVEFKIQVTQSSSYNSTIVRAMHDGTSAYVSEYGTLQVPSGIATFRKSGPASNGAIIFCSINLISKASLTLSVMTAFLRLMTSSE